MQQNSTVNKLFFLNKKNKILDNSLFMATGSARNKEKSMTNRKKMVISNFACYNLISSAPTTRVKTSKIDVT